MPNHQGFRFANNINGKLYGQFVQAVATRYSGALPGPRPQRQDRAPLPRVSYWGIYNEPNIGGWTTPQWHKVHGRFGRGLAGDLPPHGSTPPGAAW